MIDDSPDRSLELLFAAFGLFVVGLSDFHDFLHHNFIEWVVLFYFFIGLEECLVELGRLEGDRTLMTVLVKDFKRLLDKFVPI